jgi:very-short-patch-repair endonuclease
MIDINTIKKIINDYPNIEKTLMDDLLNILIENHFLITKRHYTTQSYTNIGILVRVLYFLGSTNEEVRIFFTPFEKENIYKIITKENGICKLGKTLNFNKRLMLYRGCGNGTSCICMREKLSLISLNMSDDKKNQIKEKSKQTNMERYGVEYSLQSLEIREKSKQTNMERYGVENPAQNLQIREKSKQTNIERYGVEYPTQNLEIMKKTKTTNMERYGVEYLQQSSEIREKSKQTNMEKYGVEYPAQNLEIMERTKSTNMERYGVENPSSNDIIKKKRIETNLELYGVENQFASKEVQTKTKTTNMERYGVEYPTQNLEILEKIKISSKKTNLEKFGTEFSSQRHLSKETIDLLNNSVSFIERYKSRYDYKECADELGIHQATFLIYRKKYGLEIKQNRSSYEYDLENFLLENNIVYEINNRKLIAPYELDFYLSDYNLAIEINGVYWHSEQLKGKSYHKMKYDLCSQKNIKLLTINEDEWVYRKNSIKNKILNLCGKSEKGIGARKLKIQSINNKLAMEFCEKYHIQGKTNNVKHSYGAFNNESGFPVLVAVICVGLVRNTKITNLSRFCTDGKIYAGVFSRLFKFYLIDQNPEKVITFADLRYSNGSLYETTGFIKDKKNSPDYVYVINGKTYDKQNFTKIKIKKKFPEIYSEDKTEYQMMLAIGYDRIWDCGKIRYSWSHI